MKRSLSISIRIVASTGILVTAMVWSGLASAQTQSYLLAGAFGRGEGVVVRLPVIGNSQGALCSSLVGVARLGAGTQATTPPFTTAPTPQLPGGCIPGKGGQIVSVNTGGARASFMLPENFFSQPEDDVPNRVLVPIPGIVSLTTDANFFGPLAAGPQQPLLQFTGPNQTGPNLTAVTNPAVWNRFREGAWTTQTGRAGLSFTWCNGNSNCTNVNGGQGAIIKYSGNTANGFGGTASVVLAPGDQAGSLPIIGAAGGAGGPNSILVVPVQAPVSQGGGGAGDLGGKGYAAIARNQAGNAAVYQSYMIGTDGFLSGLGPLLFTIPGTVNTSHQMPWTTGMVVGRAVLPTGMGAPNTFTFAQSGADNRTAMGEGNIQLVAGSIRRASGSDTVTPHFNGMALAFVPEPGALGMALAGGLLIIGMTRRRNA
ncbi:MAG: hypothetical protein R3F35_06905 [Myxococcota bacterium]